MSDDTKIVPGGVDGGGAAAPPSVEERMAKLMKVLEGAGVAPASAAPAAPKPDEIDYDKLAEALAKALPKSAAPAAAPAAPTVNQLPSTHGGIPDLFNMTRPQLHQLGAYGVRDALEQLWELGAQQQHRPARPVPPAKRVEITGVTEAPSRQNRRR